MPRKKLKKRWVIDCQCRYCEGRARWHITDDVNDCEIGLICDDCFLELYRVGWERFCADHPAEVLLW